MMRGGLISMLYSKATDVELTEVDTSSSLTLMSADIERIVTGMETGHEVRSSESRFEFELIQVLNKGVVECVGDCLGHVSS
jgi:hypothetical protein